MLQVLNVGQVVRTESTHLDCEVEQFIGAGAQGEVYCARVSGRPLALKWYFNNVATPQQRASLERLVQKGPPNNRFLWPLELATATAIAGFGYLMPLREPRFHSVVALMKRRIDPSFRVLATAGFEVAHSFLQLHSKGLCYRDISFGNLFLDPDTGEIVICDNDNVTVDGDPNAGVLGTPRFMAPEVVRGEAVPGTQTDLFSLAVLLFYLFYMHHPLEGKRELAIHSFDLPAMTHLYGVAPLFIFDPTDRSNEPVRGHHDNALDLWPIYPQFLRDLFTRAFTDGIHDPAHGRVREGEWRAAMIRLRDSILYCQHCGAENFYDPARLTGASYDGTCWGCGRGIRLPFRIRIGRSVVLLNRDTQLFPHHVDDQCLYDFSGPVAEVRQHPSQVGLWGLTNLSTETWSSQTPSNPAPVAVAPGRTVALLTGTRINFGRSEGEVR